MTQFDIRTRLADAADAVTPGPVRTAAIEAEARRARRARRGGWAAAAVVAATVAAIAVPFGLVGDDPGRGVGPSPAERALETCLPMAAATILENGDVGVVDEECKISKVTSTRGTALTPALSPDGTSVVFARYLGGERQKILRSQLVVADVASGRQQVIVDSEDGYAYEPTWSPDSTRVAYARDDLGNGRPAIWVYDRRTDDHELVNRGATAQSSPRWSPDGERIAFCRSGDPPALVVTTTSEPEEVRNTSIDLSPDGSGAICSGTWSPDGTRFAVLYGDNDAVTETTAYRILILDENDDVVARSQLLPEYVSSYTWAGAQIVVSAASTTYRYDESLRLLGTAPVGVTFN